ncbi:hypothetical protein N7468_001025 [Penicillium chermesinum]|uniref:50S ribosomal protein YmL27 n=1 Tax=Penicillium chermesinum TaxID=63820 RepID=A0A9W9PIU5_9EURO|nr:uncharacterized protein N7468_001025 [Penicillium chermesinum]KAJ5246042.1 hypothetical protein N7468_001025 [Penicillium chermesinum]KAJ6144338.1 hypothetical protein N7470_008233 [Penicillium chermesinum]
MFKPSPQMMARLRLTTKQVGGGYYKGTRTGSMGHFEKKGKYVLDWAKIRTYVAPDDLDDFNLTPFVSNQVDPKRDNYVQTLHRNGREVRVVDRMKGSDYLQLWNELNIEEVSQHEAEREEAERAERLREAAKPVSP